MDEIRGLRFIDPTDSDTKKCKNCGCVEGIGSIIKLKVCSKCKKVYYCDRECQKYDWQTKHKYECIVKK